MMLVSTVPVLPALDLATTAEFYTQKLGFSERHRDAEYLIVFRDTIELHFWPCSDRTLAENSGCRILVSDVEGLYHELKPAGALRPDTVLEMKEWGSKEFPVFDPNGNLITFTEPIYK